MVGINVLENSFAEKWENILKRFCALTLFGIITALIIVNIIKA